MTQNEVFSELLNLGVNLVSCDFYGGNDEGGCESITVTMSDGTVKYIPVWKEAGPNDLSVSQNLKEALQKPIYDKYGSFAGEFTVNGKLIWDVDSLKCYFKGSETDWVDFEEPVNG